MADCPTKFWIEDFSALFCSVNIIPNEQDSLEQQMNSLTRFVLLLFTLLFLIDPRLDAVFLFLCLLFIIIFYYIKRDMSSKDVVENFGPTYSRAGILPPFKPEMASAAEAIPGPTYCGIKKTSIDDVTFYSANAGNPNILTQVDPSFANKYCDEFENLNATVYNNNQNYVSPNQQLAGEAMARTRVAPIITPSPACHEFWKPNDFTITSGINSESMVDLYRSGYVVKDKNCLPTYECGKNAPYARTTKQVCKPQELSTNVQNGSEIDFGTEMTPESSNIVIENYENPDYTSGIVGNKYQQCATPQKEYSHKQTSAGDMITPMGYFPNQPRQNGLPANLGVGQAQLDPAFKQYNENVHTSIIQPGVYTQHQVMEPISENMGITFTQQFEPISEEYGEDGSTTFVSHNPRTYVPKNAKPKKRGPSTDNVYDPRFTGSGTSYRSYIEKMTGQPRFYYDDVDCHRRPNYVTRNNIDFTDYGTTYGPQMGSEFTDQKNVRQKAQDTFLNSELQHRTELQQRLMRKINANSWQQKVAPIHRSAFSRRGGN